MLDSTFAAIHVKSGNKFKFSGTHPNNIAKDNEFMREMIIILMDHLLTIMDLFYLCFIYIINHIIIHLKLITYSEC